VPLAEAVGEPVIVNPDPRLRREAGRRGWPVLDFAARLEGDAMSNDADV
jgi:phosphoserine phosphatase